MSKRIISSLIDLRGRVICLFLLIALTTTYVFEVKAQSIAQSNGRSNWPAPRGLDSDRLASAGLRILRSTHCTMVTDLPSSAAVDEIPNVVDAAMETWIERFGLFAEDLKSWRLRVYLIGERRRFDANRLMPESDQFPHGYALGYEVWLYDQPTDYYRRHLVLHEATHALMMTKLGGCGPAWYMEGIAELYGTHTWNSATQSLQLATFPANKQEAPHWGRVRLIQDALKKQSKNKRSKVNPTVPSLEALMKVDNRFAMSVDTYAWLWALAKFMDTHQRYQKRWRELSNHVLETDFDAQFLKAFATDRNRLDQEWRLFLTKISYGYDIQREAINFYSGRSFEKGRTSQSVKVSIAADQGWQSAGLIVEAGKKYQIQTEGRAVIGREANGDPWPCEAGGITLAYEGGRPLGELHATVDSDANAFLDPMPIGVGKTFEPRDSGTLYLRLNDAPNRLSENRGGISVTISAD